MELSIGFSPCPNDTFIFEALVSGTITIPGITWKVVLEDVQTLNEWALQGRLDVSKISYGVLPFILDRYIVLPAGGAIGRGVGPLLVSGTEPPYAHHATLLQKMEAISKALKYKKTGIPGAHTTAHFLLQSLFPEVTQKEFLRYDEIEAFAAEPGHTGVIIHENRFTYSQKGLYAWLDLGAAWEEIKGLPIPLGGIVTQRNLPNSLALQINRAIQQSLTKAWESYPALSSYVQCHAQAMEASVMRQHIDLYVNDFSMDMGKEGAAAILSLVQAEGYRNTKETPVFLDSSL